MGACNFCYHSGVDVGLVPQLISDEQVAGAMEELNSGGGRELSVAVRYILEEHEAYRISEEYKRAGNLKRMINSWVASVVPCDRDWVNPSHIVSVDLECGYHQGWQMWVDSGDWESVIDALISDTERRAGWWTAYKDRFQCRSIFECIAGAKNPKALRGKFSQLEIAVSAILAACAVRYGWSNVVGGGVSFDGMQEQAEQYKADADPSLLADWEQYKAKYGNYYGVYY